MIIRVLCRSKARGWVLTPLQHGCARVAAHRRWVMLNRIKAALGRRWSASSPDLRDDLRLSAFCGPCFGHSRELWFFGLLRTFLNR